MSHRDHLLYMKKTNQQVIKKLIDDITEEESLNRGNGANNHIRWQIGHLIYSDSYVLSLVSNQSADLKTYKELFGAGSKISDDSSIYPPMKELRIQLSSLQDKIIEHIEKISESDLETETGEEGSKKPLWQLLTFLCMHKFYHCGQIVDVRRSLGRERPFG